MKKIGILYSMENSFPSSLIHNINFKDITGIKADFVSIGGISMNQKLDYEVILDRASHDVPFYRSVMKKAYVDGIKVINNPFNCCAFDNFFNSRLGELIGVRVPKTAIIPAKQHTPGTNSDALRNLVYPLNWDDLFDYIGFPAFIKPNLSLSGSNSFKVFNRQEFFAAYDFTGSSIMILQESIDFEEFYRCYTIGNKTRIISVNPSLPFHMRYSKEKLSISSKLKKEIETATNKLSSALGFEINAVDFAIKDGLPYAIDYLNPVPQIESSFMIDEDFNWFIENTSDYLIEAAQKEKPAEMEYNLKNLLADL